MHSILGVILGIGLLIAGGTLLVNGASRAAAKLGISPIFVGLTVVALGTSVPELFVNVLGAFRGETALAFGNIVGSNIANLALVLGIAALIHPLVLHGDLVRREVPLLLLATTVLTVVAADSLFSEGGSRIDRADSIVLLLVFAVFAYIMVRDVLRMRGKDAIVLEIDRNPLVPTDLQSRFPAAMIGLGIVLLYAGGELTVSSSVSLAAALGLPMAQVGLFIVAIGTSMPELVTSVVAGMRREADLAVGNVIGSNLFNTLLVLPVSGVVRDIDTPPGGLIDLAFSWLLVAMLIPIFFFGKARLGRFPAAIALCAYGAWAYLRLV